MVANLGIPASLHSSVYYLWSLKSLLAGRRRLSALRDPAPLVRMNRRLPVFLIVGGILLALVGLFVLTLLFFWIVLAVAPGSRFNRTRRDARDLRSAAEKFALLQAEHDRQMPAGISRRAS
jgi:hypothetical protein